MGVDISVPGENSFATPSPVTNFILPVEFYRPVTTILDTPLGNIKKMVDDNEKKEYLVKTVFSDLTQMSNSIAFFKEMQNHSLSYFPTILPFAGFTVSNPHCGRRPALVFETYKGMKLDQVLEAEASGHPVDGWDLTAKIRTALGIATALSFIHGYGFVHGNVCADSIVFDENLWPLLADFTLTNYFDEKLASIMAPEKPRIWRAPELVGETDRTKKGDVFAFAMLMLQIFIGKKAYASIENSTDIVARLKANNRPKISEDVAPEIKKIIQQCWAPNPGDRPTMTEVVKNFEENIGAVPCINLQELEKFREKLKHASEEIEKARNVMTSANSGDAAAQNNFGVMLLNGKGVRRNVVTAARYFQASADQGCIEGMHNCGFALENGSGVKKDLVLAAKYFKAAADKGFKTAQNSYAQLLVKGAGVERNCVEAAKYFKMAAQQNHAPAQYRLGLLYELGEGVNLNYNEALKCYRAASALKFPPAMYRFGALILNGLCAEKNRVEGFRSVIAAAQAGYPRAISLFGAMALAGDGTRKDPELARKQFTSAENKKEPSGTFGLAILNLVQKKPEAWDFLKKAAKTGYADAERIYSEFSTSEEEKKQLLGDAGKGGIEKETVLPFQILLKGTSITPSIEGVVAAFKELPKPPEEEDEEEQKDEEKQKE